METDLENTPWKTWKYQPNDIKNCIIEFDVFVNVMGTGLTGRAVQQTVLSSPPDGLEEESTYVNELPSPLFGPAMMYRTLGNLYGQFLPSRSVQSSWKQGNRTIKVANSAKQ